MSYVLNTLLCVTLFSTAALGAMKDGVIEVKKGQKVYYNASITASSKPTLILLPGVYRGIQKEDEVAKLLRKRKLDYVAIHFSGHPKSVAHYGAYESTVFSGGKGLTSKMLATEVEAVVEALQIQKPIPVSLSYSATVIPHLDPKKYPVVIETAPIGVFGEDDSAGHALRQQWADWIRMWPIWGPIWVESAKSTAYRNHWSKIAVERAAGEKNEKPIANVNTLTEGYMAMARASEDFDLRNQNFKKTASRIWILAELEEEFRRTIQDEAIEVANKTLGKKISPIVIPEAGHTIPMEQPEAYVEVLEAILTKLE